MSKSLLLFFLSSVSIFFLTACGDNAFDFLSEDDSDEACAYETSVNLDNGNYEAVLASPCAGSVQRGAAYFGLAGYDIKDVINSLSEAQGDLTPLDLYMSALVGLVTNDTLNYLYAAKTEYLKIRQGDILYQDAQFYAALVEAVNALSLLKILIDDDGDGSVSECDINGNGSPDDADAAACALLAAAGQTCTDASYTQTPPPDITFQGKTGNYRGLAITISGVPTTACGADYSKLMYNDGTGNYFVATTTSEVCRGSDGNSWPCPVEINGRPLDFVDAIEETLNNSSNALDEALGTTTDVGGSIDTIREDACGIDGQCTSDEIAGYILTL